MNRDAWQEPERVIEALEIEPGSAVVDLGSGSGYFTFRLADATGADGRVYAADLNRRQLKRIDTRAGKQGYPQIATVLATVDDPQLPEAVDLVFLVNTYHHIDDRSAYFRRLQGYLQPEGRVAIIDLERLPWHLRWILRNHRIESETVRHEMEAAGFQLQEQHDFLRYQNFLIFGLSRGG